MNKNLVPLLPVAMYLFVGLVTFGNHEILFPLTVIGMGIISFFTTHKSYSFIHNLFRQTIVVSAFLAIGFIFKDADNLLIFKYILSFILVSAVAILIRQNTNNTYQKVS